MDFASAFGRGLQQVSFVEGGNILTCQTITDYSTEVNQLHVKGNSIRALATNLVSLEETGLLEATALEPTITDQATLNTKAQSHAWNLPARGPYHSNQPNPRPLRPVSDCADNPRLHETSLIREVAAERCHTCYTYYSVTEMASVKAKRILALVGFELSQRKTEKELQERLQAFVEGYVLSLLFKIIGGLAGGFVTLFLYFESRIYDLNGRLSNVEGQLSVLRSIVHVAITTTMGTTSALTTGVSTVTITSYYPSFPAIFGFPVELIIVGIVVGILVGHGVGIVVLRRRR